MIIALNGQDVMSIPSFHEINFEGVCRDHSEGGKSDVRCNNINVTYGYANLSCLFAVHSLIRCCHA